MTPGRAHGFDDRRDQSKGSALEDPIAGRFDEIQALPDLLFGLGSETFQGGDLAGFGGDSQVGQAFDLKSFVQGFNFFWTEAGHSKQGDETLGKFGPEGVK